MIAFKFPPLLSHSNTPSRTRNENEKKEDKGGVIVEVKMSKESGEELSQIHLVLGESLCCPVEKVGRAERSRRAWKVLAGRETAGNPQSGRESVFVVEVDSIEEPGVSLTESAIPQRSRPPRLLLRVFLLSSSTALYPSLSLLPPPRPSTLLLLLL